MEHKCTGLMAFLLVPSIQLLLEQDIDESRHIIEYRPRPHVLNRLTADTCGYQQRSRVVPKQTRYNHLALSTLDLVYRYRFIFLQTDKKTSEKVKDGLLWQHVFFPVQPSEDPQHVLRRLAVWWRVHKETFIEGSVGYDSSYIACCKYILAFTNVLKTLTWKLRGHWYFNYMQYAYADLKNHHNCDPLLIDGP